MRDHEKEREETREKLGDNRYRIDYNASERETECNSEQRIQRARQSLTAEYE